MANKKKNNFNSKKKKTTKKSNSTAKKTTSKKKTTSTTKKTTARKNTAVKTKTAAKKTTSTKPKTSSTKKTTTKKVKEPITIVSKEPIKVQNDDITISLPKLKGQTKEVSKNTNKPERVIKTEEFTVIKKEPIRYKGKEKSAPVVGKKRVTKSNAKKVESRKKNNFLKGVNKLKRKIKMYGITSVIPMRYIALLCIIILALIVIPIIINIFNIAPKIDISSIPEKIDQLTTVSFNINDVSDIISSSDAYSSLKDYYEYDFRETFELNPNYVDEYVIKYNKSKKQVFIAIKAIDKHYDDVKNSIDNFLKNNEIKDYEYLEYQGYQIYIKSSNNAVVVSKIKQSQKRVFNILKDLKKEDIADVFKITDADYDEALVKTAMVIRSDTCGYAIFKPKNPSSKEKIKNLMEDYYNGLEAKWQNNEDNRKLVQNRHFEEYQGYLIYIVSHDNDLVVQLLKS